MAIDIDAESISLDYGGLAAGLAAGAVFSFTDLDWVGVTGEIVGVSVSTNWDNWSDDYISFGSDSIEIAPLVTQWYDNTTDYFIIDITASHGSGGSPVVPEPATMTLMGLGLAGMAMRRRKAKEA